MSLQIDFTDPTIAGGADFPQAYCHIDEANLPTLTGALNVVVGIYVDAAHFNAGKPAILKKTVTLTNADANTLRASFRSQVETMLAANPAAPPYPPFNGGISVP